jgi:sulfite reductase (ferredoxin)
MKASNALWKDVLSGRMPPHLAREIDVFETEIVLRKQGKIDERVFGETRLRRGVYGQRYDNGQRHDGKRIRQLAYPNGALTKGPHTIWDAPGMQRIKIPFGGITPEQLEVIAELAEEYSTGVAHVTTRQDFQLHFVHLENTPALMRRLAAVGITTREACGNTVRNVTGCPLAGVCRTEAFDVTPYAKALAYFLLGHPDTQEFGRKFKISFSGCRDAACALAHMHDIGFIAVVRQEAGRTKRGFEVLVGGGLGTVPQQAKCFSEFIPEEELLPVAQAICRVFARHGEKKNRNTARLKFLVTKLGIDAFGRLVAEERAILTPDPRWTAFLGEIPREGDNPPETCPLTEVRRRFSEGFEAWSRTNVYAQRQKGYAAVTVALPLGDITAAQLRKLADMARRYSRETLRTTMEQNLVMRWVKEADLEAVYDELKAVGLGEAGAGTITDIVACPGTDTCKLGISSSRGLAAELRRQIAAYNYCADQAVRNLHIKVSGCFNSCGHHHLADLGFYGVSRSKGSYAAPHFQVLIGGRWRGNGGAYGLAIGAVPAKRIPRVVERFVARYARERNEGETFESFITRIGKAECKRMIEDLTDIPDYAVEPSLFSDWGDPREFTLGDRSTGEGAGLLVSRFEFRMAACDREAFEAQLQLERGEVDAAARTAYLAMLGGAAALLEQIGVTVERENAAALAEAFRSRFYDTKLFWDPFAQGKFGQYLFQAHAEVDEPKSADRVRRLIEEAQLFLEACHSCHARMQAAASA